MSRGFHPAHQPANAPMGPKPTSVRTTASRLATAVTASRSRRTTAGRSTRRLAGFLEAVAELFVRSRLRSSDHDGGRGANWVFYRRALGRGVKARGKFF